MLSTVLTNPFPGNSSIMSGFIIRKYLFLLAIFLFASAANAATFTISTPAADGSFTLTWSGVRSYAEIYEVVNGSRQKIGGQYNPSGNLGFSRGPGTYTFILIDVYVYGSQGGGPPQENRIEIQKSVTVTPPAIPPATPASITVIPDSFADSITVSWPSTTGATRYELERNGNNVYSGAAITATPANSIANTSYTFRVSACNSYGCSGWRTASAVTLQETFGVPATNTTGQYNINVVTPGHATETRIEESSSANGPWNTIATLQGNQSYPVTRNNGTYYYRLLYCVITTQSSNCTLRNQVKSIVVAQPAPAVSANFNPSTINEGGSATLNWGSSNAASCSAPGIGGVNSASGSITYNAPGAMSANSAVNVTVTCNGGGGGNSTVATLNINWVNDSPTISNIAPRSINEDTSTSAIGFTVGDEETPTSLNVTASSDNQGLIPNGNIQLAGTGTNRTITVVPAANQFGLAKITVRVTDPNGAATETSFNVTVNSVDDAPVISALGNITINELAETTIGFSVNDIDSGVDNVTATSSLTTLVTSTLSGGGNNYSVNLKAARFTTSGTSGQATIKVSVPFGSNPVERTFTVTVNNLEPQLWIEETGTVGVYDLKWDYATAGARIFENGVDITSSIVSSGNAPVVGSKRITKTSNGTFTYYIQDCASVSQVGLVCQGTYSQKVQSVVFPIPAAPTFKPNPTPNNTGGYSIEWNTVAYAKRYELFENDLAVDNGGNPLWVSKPYTNKTTGVHTYKVRACNDSGCGGFSTVQTVKVANPGTITSVNAVMNNTTGVADLTLTTTGAATRYEVQARVNAGAWGTTQTFTAKTFSLPAISIAGTYSYQVRPCSTASDYTACASWVLSNNASAAVPTQPTLNLSSTNSTGSISMSWTNPGNTSRYVLNDNGTDLPDQIVATTYGPVVKANGSYSYKVKACNAVGCGNYSTTSVIHVAKIGSMGSVTAVLNQTSGITALNWTGVSGATRYEIQPLLNGSNNGSVITSTSTTANMPVVTVAGSYSYKVRACAVVSSYTNCSGWVTSNAVVPQVPASAPVVTAPLNSISGIFSVKWTEVTNADRYEVYENGSKIASVSALKLDFTSSNPKATGQYTYKIRACKALCGPESNQAKINVVRSSASSSSSSSGSVLSLPAIDPLNDVMFEEKYVGGLKGAHAVGADGSFNYTLPIVIPPGINGMQPNLGLSYNSNRKHDLAGWGWSLTGLSSITRCAATMIRDGYVSGIQNGDNYRYCLDGQRLVEISTGEYRTESESFLRIKKISSHWVVTNNNGTTMRYGYNTDSYQSDSSNEPYAWYLDQQKDVSGNSLTISYNKDTTAGTHTPNQIDYTQNTLLGTQHSIVFGYESRPDMTVKMVAGTKTQLKQRLTTIDVKSYGTSLRTYTLEYQEVGQTYHNKLYSDPANTSRLSKVTLCYSGSTECAEPLEFNWNSQHQDNYLFGLSSQAALPDLSGESEVELMLDINGDGLLEPFIGGGPANEWFSTQVNGRPYGARNRYYRADVNADGRDDVIKFGDGLGVYLSNGTTIDTTPVPGFNIDLEQLVFYSGAHYVALGFDPYDWDTEPDDVAYALHFVDLNADGYVDVVRVPTCVREINEICHYQSSPGDISVAFNNQGTGFQPFVSWYSNWKGGLENQQLQFGDVNGDGALDFVSSALFTMFQTYDTYIALNNGRGTNGGQFVLSTKYTSNLLPGILGDFNGDGIVDIAKASSSNIKVSLGTGRPENAGETIDGFLPSQTLGGIDRILSCGSSSLPNKPSEAVVDVCSRSAIDFNNDGLTDFVEWGKRVSRTCLNGSSTNLASCNHVGSTITHYEGRVYLSKGADANGNISFTQPVLYKNLATLEQIDDVYSTNRDPRSKIKGFNDYDNDGAIEDDYRLKNRVLSHRLEGIYDASNSVDVIYSQLSSNLVYQVASESTIETGDSSLVANPSVISRRFAVKEIRVSNGVGGINKINYTYTGSKIHGAGYGDLGFATVTKIETPVGEKPIRTYTSYYQTANAQYNLSGRPKREIVYVHTGTGWQMLSDTRYQWKVRIYSDDLDTSYESPHYFAYVYERSSQTWDADDTKIADSLTQNHPHSGSKCTQLSTSPSIRTTSAGSSADIDYHPDGVLLYSETAICDQSGSTAAVQIRAMENMDITNKGEARGLVGKHKTYAWVGSAISLANKSFYEFRTLGFTYNSLGQLETKTTEPDIVGASTLKFVSTYTYNAYGSVKTLTESWDDMANDGLDVNSRVTSITETYDAAGVRKITVTKPANLVESTEFHPVWGEPTKHTDANNLITRTDYDLQGRPTLMTYPDNTTTRFDYRECAANDFSYSDYCEWYSQTKTTGSAAQRTYYDSYHRPIGTRDTGLDGSAIYTLQHYNSRGQVYEATPNFYYGEARNPITNLFDSLGRVTQVTYPDGAVEYRSYSGLTHSITNRLNQTQVRYLNGSGWVMRSMDNTNTPVDFTYGYFGELKTTQVNNDPKTQVSMLYDALGRKTQLTDPNTGTITYTYNALDLLATQTDAKNQRTCYRYDSLGRQTGRVDNASSDCTGSATQTWAYDTKPKGKGLLASLTGINTDGSSYSEQYTYTSFSLPQTTTTSFGGASYNITQHYDSFNRPLGITYPGGYIAANRYNDYGVMDQVRDSTGTTLWTANADDSLGNITQFTLGNGVVTNQTFDPDTGRIEHIRAVKNSLVIQDQIYAFDSLGNLTQRQDVKNGVTQSFCYDGLNRLKAARFNGCSTSTNDYTYDTLGNLTNKTDAGGSALTLAYTGEGQSVNNAGPHAVTSANGWSYIYDANGNVTQAIKSGQSTKTVAYSVFNTPTSITQGSKFSTLVYGPNQDRIKHSDSNGRVTKYVGGVYEEVTKGGITQKLHYVGDFAIFIQKGGITPTNSYEYLHRDHIGSIVAISNSAANTNSDIQLQTNGAWGERRFQQWNGPLDNALIPTTTANGFTDHEHLDAVGLIHMNGRVYDPELGRFLSADPYVQSPYNSQSYNRYAYVFNNPLSYTDPTGYEAEGEEPPTEESDPTIGDRERINNRCPNGSTCANGEGSIFFLTRIMGGEREQWVYLNGVGYNFADLRGILAYSLAAGMPKDSSGSKGGFFSMTFYGGMGMMPYTPGGGGGTTGVQNLSWEQQKEGAAMVAANLATAGIAEVVIIGRAAWLSRGASATTTTSRSASSIKQGANLREHLRQVENYGKGGVRALPNGKIRYYGETVPANKAGEMAGRRTVREWDPATGNKRTWLETLDHNGTVRQVRPEFNDGTKIHYMFDATGNYTRSW